jgi:hypothetical protein
MNTTPSSAADGVGRHESLAGDDPELRRFAAWITTATPEQLSAVRRIVEIELDQHAPVIQGELPTSYTRTRIAPGYTWACEIPNRRWVTESRFGWALSRAGGGDFWRLSGNGVELSMGTSYLIPAMRKVPTVIHDEGLKAKEPGDSAATHPRSDQGNSP